MTHLDYRAARMLSAAAVSVESLLMAAMRIGDRGTRQRLEAAFPGVADELTERDLSPDGRIPSDDQHRVIGATR